MKKLFITNARIRLMYGSDQINPVSRFISEIDDDLLDNVGIKIISEKNPKIDYNNNERKKTDKNNNYKESEMSYQVGDFVYHELPPSSVCRNLCLFFAGC